MEFDYSKLKGLIVEKYGTQSKFAEALGVAPLTVSRKLNGETGFDRDDILIWSKLLDIKIEDISDYFFVQKV